MIHWSLYMPLLESQIHSNWNLQLQAGKSIHNWTNRRNSSCIHVLSSVYTFQVLLCTWFRLKSWVVNRYKTKEYEVFSHNHSCCFTQQQPANFLGQSKNLYNQKGSPQKWISANRIKRRPETPLMWMIQPQCSTAPYVLITWLFDHIWGEVNMDMYIQSSNHDKGAAVSIFGINYLMHMNNPHTFSVFMLSLIFHMQSFQICSFWYLLAPSSILSKLYSSSGEHI